MNLGFQRMAIFVCMNRLIIVGNGFDLAHGLETSYTSFIANLIEHSIKAKRDTGSSNEIFNIDLGLVIKYSEILGNTSIRDPDLAYLTKKLIENNEILRVLISPSDFIIDIVNSISNNRWVDLEYTYFKNIVKCNERNLESDSVSHKIDLLNNQWEGLKNALVKFLTNKIETNYTDIKYNEFFYEKYRNLVDVDSDNSGASEKTLINNHYFINFNYSITYRRYLNPKDLDKCIDIHGLLHIEKENVIFGWGDDTHPLYKKIEELNDNRYLKHTKSFSYLNSRKYKKLMSIISGSPFEVYIFGHSCGLSDRTMLESIFNSKNCTQIKIFYHENSKGNDYQNKVIEISRHCPDKVGLRKKIISFEDCKNMPSNID